MSLTPNRYEAALERHRGATGGLSSRLADASRRTRDGFDGHSAVREVAATVAGPFLAAYVLWVLRRAEEEGLGRLYFVARDGQAMLRIAERLAPALGINVELRYLYGSRQAWHLPSVQGCLEERDIDRLLSGQGLLTANDVEARLSLPETLKDELARRFSPPNRRLTPSEVGDLKAWMRRPDVTAATLASALAARESLLGYLGQEGVLSGRPFGIVDLGWSGRMQESLAKVIIGTEAPQASAFFVMLHRGSPNPLCLARDVFVDAETAPQRQVGAIQAAMSLLEAFCAADHPRTKGYRARNGAWEPVFDGETLPELQIWGVTTQLDALGQYANHLAERLSGTDWRTDLREPALDVLRLLATSPSFEEARCIGAFPFEPGLSDNGSIPLASPVVGWRALCAILRRPGPALPHEPWSHGAVRLSSRWVRALLAARSVGLNGARSLKALVGRVSRPRRGR